MNYTVDNAGTITNAVAVSDIITKIQNITLAINESVNRNAEWQAEIDALNAVLVQVAQAPDTDPAILQMVQAIPAVANQLQSVNQSLSQHDTGTN